ncbi:MULTISPECIES: hypothetical protein [Thermomonosporaceae]|uniref:hypothetical protein n=1 Tax=Thermomonosporaceae TaxID=2012 RepID=UPI00255AA355|nr:MULTISPECIES: hypothetical protein [Thermomonosporaceae]MDL4772004.1 hypothetical protein [Actinomadura xylanilytica]
MRIVTEAMVWEAKQLANRAGVVARRVKTQSEHLDLAAAGLMTEHLCECLDAVAAALTSARARVQQITERETTEQAGRSGPR